MQKEGQELEIGGTLQQKIWSCLAVLDRFMIEGNTIVSSMIVAEERSTGLTSNNLVEAIANKLGTYIDMLKISRSFEAYNDVNVT